MRDTQRTKLYSAESVMGIKSEDLTLEGCEKLVNKLQKKYIKNVKHSIKVECLRESHRAYYSPQQRKISLPSWSRNRYVILHEFAHYLTHMVSYNDIGRNMEFNFKLPNDMYEVARKDCNYFAGHGAMFTYILLMLVRKELGAIQYEALKNSMNLNKVKTVNSNGKVVKVRASK